MDSSPGAPDGFPGAATANVTRSGASRTLSATTSIVTDCEADACPAEIVSVNGATTA